MRSMEKTIQKLIFNPCCVGITLVYSWSTTLSSKCPVSVVLFWLSVSAGNWNRLWLSIRVCIANLVKLQRVVSQIRSVAGSGGKETANGWNIYGLCDLWPSYRSSSLARTRTVTQF